MHSGYQCLQAIYAIETTYTGELLMSLGYRSLQATYAFELPIPMPLGYLCVLATYNFEQPTVHLFLQATVNILLMYCTVSLIMTLGDLYLQAN